LNYKKRAETTYTLEVERKGDMSDRGCDYKTRAGATYLLEVEREDNMSDRSCDYKTRARTTYILEVVRVTSQSAVETTKRGQGRRTNWRWRGRAAC
jgi:hypothetical protein